MARNNVRQLEKLLASGKITEEEYEEELEKLENEQQLEEHDVKYKRAAKYFYHGREHGK